MCGCMQFCLELKHCGIFLFCSLTFLLNCLVFFTWQCVLLFAMNRPCSIILIKGIMKKLVSQLKWHYVSQQKRSVFVSLLVSPMCEAPSLLKYTLIIPYLQVGLPGFNSMPSSLNMLTKHERASYCNHYWEEQFRKVSFSQFLTSIFHLS